MTDLELWRKLRSGDRSALEQIYRMHVTSLLRYGRKFSLSEALVEDCVQDMFIDLWRRRAHISETDSIRKYLFVALRRRIIRALHRHDKRFSEKAAEEYDFQATLTADHQLTAEETANERSASLRQAFEALSPRQKEIIYLKYYGGLDYEEIGAVMDLNYQSARNLVNRALQRLRDCLLLGFLVLTRHFFFAF